MPPAAPEVIWGVFTRLLALVYLVSFASLHGQVDAIAGARGIAPVRPRLARIRRDFPRPWRYLYFPTLLWLWPTDRALRLLPVAGVACAVAAAWGGPQSPWALAACWALYLSLDLPADLAFPWDCLLFEAGFLALFLPALEPLPAVAAIAAPLPALGWAYRWLLFRLLLGFGRKKLRGITRKDLGYLQDFLINQPLPTPLAWRAHRLRAPVLRAALGGLFAAELVAPFLLFLPGAPRLAAAAAIVALMVVIQLHGNYGYFNLLVAVLCVPLLDAQASIAQTFAQPSAQLWATPGAAAVHLVALAALVGGLLHLPLDSWSARSWLYWPAMLRARPAWLRAVYTGLRAAAPFRLIHAYGVFPAHGSPPCRWAPVIEGTRDGEQWHEYGYRFFPTTPTSPPRFFAPYQPRLDHFAFYDAFGLPGPFLSSAFSSHDPYRHGAAMPMERLLQRLLEGGSPVTGLLGSNPFPDPHQPPSAVRVRLYLLRPTTPAQRAVTGAWWTRRPVGEHLPARGADPGLWDRWLPDPERFHWDDLVWRERAPATRALLRAGRGDADPEAALLAASPDLSPAELDGFWRDLIEHPALAGGWDDLPRQVAWLGATVDAGQIRRWERLWLRLSLLLAARLEPHHLGTRPPPLGLASWFHMGLLAAHVIRQGRQAWRAAARDPAAAAAQARAMTDASGFHLWALFGYDHVVYAARKARLVGRISRVEPGGGLLGFVDLIPFLFHQLPQPDEDLPPITRDLTGAWQVGP